MNKKLIGALALAFSLLALFSCASDEKEQEETVQKQDWRNTIGYESSFFVNESTKLLYALDTGSITLWDNGGSGEVLQVIEYGTTVSDAIERIEKEDFNGDGNRDIRIIYSESEKGTRYTLFLWNEKATKYSECKLYSELTDPKPDEASGNIVAVEDLGVFGIVTKTYAFNDTLGLDEVSIVISDPEGVAKKVAEALGGGEMKPAVGNVKIENNECTVYVLTKDGEDKAYVAYNKSSRWYADIGQRGFYREMCEEEGSIVSGRYVDDAGSIESLCEKIKGDGPEVLSRTPGQIGDKTAEQFKISYEDGSVFYLAKDENGYWYYGENGAECTRISASSGEAVEDTVYEFLETELTE